MAKACPGQIRLSFPTRLGTAGMAGPSPHRRGQLLFQLHSLQMIALLWCMWRTAGALPCRLETLVVADDRLELAFDMPFSFFP